MKQIYLSDFREIVFTEISGYFHEKIYGDEVGFWHDMGSDFKLVILTSVDKQSETIKEKDAIRVLLKQNNEIILMKPHTKRTDGYGERLVSKVNDILLCSNCEAESKIAHGEYGYYYFCTEGCGETQSIEM